MHPETIPIRTELEQIIRDVFAGITLGGGVGLWWGQVLDAYKIPDYVEDYRKNREHVEERSDWSRIPADDLNCCYSSLYFFDAEGMRFHLPAFMLLELSGNFNCSLVYILANVMDNKFRDYKLEQFSLLDTKQRMAVRSFLQYCANHPDYGFDVPDINRALGEYWLDTNI